MQTTILLKKFMTSVFFLVLSVALISVGPFHCSRSCSIAIAIAIAIEHVLHFFFVVWMLRWNRNREKSRSTTVTRHCFQIIQQFSKESNLQCALCLKTLSLGKGKISSYYAINHATAMHLRKPLYACRFCAYFGGSQAAIRTHLMNRHKRSSSGNYIDHSKRYEKEIIEVLSKCYGRIASTDLDD